MRGQHLPGMSGRIRRDQKNDFRDAEAIAEAVLRPTMKFVAIKTVEQLDLQGLHRVRERLVCQRTSVINQIRAFLLERGIAVRQGLRALRTAMPNVLAMTDKLSPRIIHMIEDLCTDWRYLDGRIATVSNEIETLSEQAPLSRRGFTFVNQQVIGRRPTFCCAHPPRAPSVRCPSFATPARGRVRTGCFVCLSPDNIGCSPNGP